MRVSGLTLSAGAAFLILIGLGTWQLQRRTEKLDYIARYESGMHAPAQPFPSQALWQGTDFSKFEHRKVDIEGHFVAAPEVHLYALLPMGGQPYGGVGWWVLMPFELSDGGVVYVNRGFVPQSLKNPLLRKSSLAQPGEQKLTGSVRLPEKPGVFTPANNPNMNEWYYRDPAAFASYDMIDEKKVAPVVIDQLTPNENGLPQVTNGKLNIPNNHLQYAITWYALAALLLVFYIALRHQQKRAKKA